MVKPAIDALPQVRSIILPVRNARFLDSGRVTNVFALHPESGMVKNACALDQQHGTESNVLAQLHKSFKTVNVYALHLKLCKMVIACILLAFVAKINVPVLKMKFC